VTEPKKTVRRGDARRRTERDLERFERRDSGGRFWHSLALIGSVGWPIVLLATGGAIFGRHLDDRFETGVRFTLLFLTLGTAVGTFIAFRTAAGKEA
jgi:hypothetical protein